jgi:K+/H+ antiporter YhaU regulatory subunit KhtT
MGMVHVADYDLLLKVQSGYCVSELEISAGNQLAGEDLGDSRPADKGIVVLGITKPSGEFIGAPRRHETVEIGDTLLVYGSESAIQSMHLGSEKSSS